MVEWLPPRASLAHPDGQVEAFLQLRATQLVDIEEVPMRPIRLGHNSATGVRPMAWWGLREVAQSVLLAGLSGPS